MILLQTIPDTIDIEIFKKTLLDGFKDIVSVHDLHIWQLSGNQYVSTVHIIFDNPKVYLKIQSDVIEFFHEQGINQVTIQPEFKVTDESRTLGNCLEGCLIQCRTIAQCASRTCCDTISHEEAANVPLLTEVVALPRTDSSDEPKGSEVIQMNALSAVPSDEQASAVQVTDVSSESMTTAEARAGDSGKLETVDVSQANAEEGSDSATVQRSPVKTECQAQETEGDKSK